MIEEIKEKLVNYLKLRTFPVGISFLSSLDNLPNKLRQPSSMGFKLTVCQAISWARFYSWRVLFTKEDLNCLPGGLVFNFMKSEKMKNEEALSKLMVEVGWVKEEVAENQKWTVWDKEIAGLLIEPLDRASRVPDVVVIYAEPAQVARLAQGYGYISGKPIEVKLSGRVACAEYVILPYLENTPVITTPGAGDRIFSGAQDNELVFSAPHSLMKDILIGLQEAGSKIGTNRYPFPPYMLHEVKFPSVYEKLKGSLGIK